MLKKGRRLRRRAFLLNFSLSYRAWGKFGIRVNFYHFFLVDGMVSEKWFTAILFNYLFL